MKRIILLLITIVLCYSELSLLACEQEKKQVKESRLPKNIYNLIRSWKSFRPGTIITIEDVANMRELEEFLRNKDNLEARDEHGNSLLILASQVSNRDNLVYYLLGSGANVNSVNRMGETALWNAVYHRNPETVRILLDYGANIDKKTLNHAKTMFFGIKNRRGEGFEQHKFKGRQQILNLLQYYPDYLEKEKQGELQNITFDDYVLARKVGEELKRGQYLPDVLNQEIIEYISGSRKAPIKQG